MDLRKLTVSLEVVVGVILMAAAYSFGQVEERQLSKNDNVTLQCQTGPGSHAFSWLKSTLSNGNTFQTVEASSLNGGQWDVTGTLPKYVCTGSCDTTLNVNNVQVQDSGNYKCEIRTSGKTTLKQYKLVILDAPDEYYFQVDGKRYKDGDKIPLTQGVEAKVMCIVTNSYPPAQAVFEGDNYRDFQEAQTENGTEPFTKTTTTTLRVNAEKNLKQLVCKSSIDHKGYKETSITATADVQYPPEGKVDFSVTNLRPAEAAEPQDVPTYNVKVDDKVSFRCVPEVDGNPATDRLLLLDGKEVSNELFTVENDVITFTVDHFDHSGVYGCRAKNDLGYKDSESTKSIQLRVTGGRPSITKKTRSSYRLEMGETAYLTVDFCAMPAPSETYWSWSEGGTKPTKLAVMRAKSSTHGSKIVADMLEENGATDSCPSLYRSTLQIISPTEKESRNYKFVVRNDAGNDTLSVSVTFTSSSIGAGEILGILLAILIVVCIVLAVVAYVRKIWCFKKSFSPDPAGDKEEREKMNTNNADSKDPEKADNQD